MASAVGERFGLSTDDCWKLAPVTQSKPSDVEGGRPPAGAELDTLPVDGRGGMGMGRVSALEGSRVSVSAVSRRRVEFKMDP